MARYKGRYTRNRLNMIEFNLRVYTIHENHLELFKRFSNLYTLLSVYAKKNSLSRYMIEQEYSYFFMILIHGANKWFA